MFIVVRMSACRSSSCCTFTSVPYSLSKVEYCRNACHPSLPTPTFSPARSSQRCCALQRCDGIPVRWLGKPSRSLEEAEEPCADGPARVSQVRDRVALASLNFQFWARQYGHRLKTAGFALGASPNRSRTIADPEPR